VSIKKVFIYKLFILLLLFTALVNFYLLSLPLFKEFSYEFATVNGLLFFITIPILIFSNYKRNREAASKYFQIIFLLITPLIVVMLNYFSIEICSIIDGLNFYLVIALVSGIVAYLMGEIIYIISPKRTNLLLIISLIILILIPILELYLYPQIYFYSPLIGFFPGSIYDEDINIDYKLIIYRLLNFLFIYSFYILSKRSLIKSKTILACSIVVALVVSFFLSPILGFSTNEKSLTNILPNKIETDKFIIYFDKIDSVEQNILSLHFHYYFSELEKSVKTTPSKKVKAFVFENYDDKRKYFGSGNADVAKPWLYQIYLDKYSWKSTLRHELAHIFSAEFGSSFLKLAGDLNPFLIEGFATANDPFIDILSVDNLAAIHYKNSNQNIISSLNRSLNFFGFNSTLSYIYSGSFCKFLIESYGIEKFKRYYSGNNFEEVYSKNFLEVTEDYLNFLKKTSTDSSSGKFHYYFGRKALIQKNCPRYIEKQIKKGWSYFEEEDIVEAKKIFLNVLNHSDNYSALIGLTECLVKQDSLSKAILLLKQNIQKFEKTPYEYLANFKLADIYALSDENNQAIELYKNLEHHKPNMNLQTLSNLRIVLLNEGLLKKYLLADDSVKFNILLRLNEKNYCYPSIPILLTLTNNLRIDNEKFLSIFNKPFVNFDNYSFYAFLKLSQYLVDNFDFTKARKVAALSKRLNSDEIYAEYLDNNYKMIEWFYFNSKKL